MQFRTTHEARSVLEHYRDYARVCGGRHATDDGDGNAATLQVRGWRPGRVGDETVGLLDAFTVYGATQWRRSVVARVGRTVVFTVVEPNRGPATRTSPSTAPASRSPSSGRRLLNNAVDASVARVVGCLSGVPAESRVQRAYSVGWCLDARPEGGLGAFRGAATSQRAAVAALAPHDGSAGS